VPIARGRCAAATGAGANVELALDNAPVAVVGEFGLTPHAADPEYMFAVDHRRIGIGSLPAKRRISN
jgi:hypothetical protein